MSNFDQFLEEFGAAASAVVAPLADVEVGNAFDLKPMQINNLGMTTLQGMSRPIMTAARVEKVFLVTAMLGRQLLGGVDRAEAARQRGLEVQDNWVFQAILLLPGAELGVLDDAGQFHALRSLPPLNSATGAIAQALSADPLIYCSRFSAKRDVLGVNPETDKGTLLSMLDSLGWQPTAGEAPEGARRERIWQRSAARGTDGAVGLPLMNVRLADNVTQDGQGFRNFAQAWWDHVVATSVQYAKYKELAAQGIPAEAPALGLLQSWTGARPAYKTDDAGNPILDASGQPVPDRDASGRARMYRQDCRIHELTVSTTNEWGQVTPHTFVVGERGRRTAEREAIGEAAAEAGVRSAEEPF